MDILIGTIGAVVGAALSLAGVIFTAYYKEHHSTSHIRREYIGRFIAESEKHLKTHLHLPDIQDAYGDLLPYLSAEEQKDAEAAFLELSLKSPDPEKVRYHTRRLCLPDNHPRRWFL